MSLDLLPWSTIPYPDYYLPPDLAEQSKFDGTLEDVLCGHEGYLFCEVDDLSALGRLLAADLDVSAILPFPLSRDTVLIKQFCAGQSGSGAPWHWHEDSFNIGM